MKTPDFVLQLTVFRCRDCRGVMLDVDLKLGQGCIHCGTRPGVFFGSGPTTKEEENWIERRANQLYEFYEEVEARGACKRASSGSPRPEWDGPPGGRVHWLPCGPSRFSFGRRDQRSERRLERYSAGQVATSTSGSACGVQAKEVV